MSDLVFCHGSSSLVKLRWMHSSLPIQGDGVALVDGYVDCVNYSPGGWKKVGTVVRVEIVDTNHVYVWVKMDTQNDTIDTPSNDNPNSERLLVNLLNEKRAIVQRVSSSRDGAGLIWSTVTVSVFWIFPPSIARAEKQASCVDKSHAAHLAAGC